MSDKKKLLFLSASPRGEGALEQDREMRDVEREIAASLDRREFEIASAWAVRTDDLQRALLAHRPNIVHFSGHGSEDGIILENDYRQGVPVDGETLADLFRILHGKTNIILLNACDTHRVAEALQQVVDCTIAMQGRISDAAAISFARAFYRGLGWRETPASAFALGISQLRIDRLNETHIPRLFTRAAGEPKAAEPRKRRGHIHSLIHLVESTTGDIIAVDGNNNVVTRG